MHIEHHSQEIRASLKRHEETSFPYESGNIVLVLSDAKLDIAINAHNIDWVHQPLGSKSIYEWSMKNGKNVC